MATIKEIEDLAANDLPFRLDNLDIEASNNPRLHSRFYKILNTETLVLRNFEHELAKLLLDKFEYYAGKADPDVYVKEPLDKIVLKTDIDRYIDGDATVIRQRLRVEGQRQKVKYVESVIKEIGQRRWDIRSAIDYLKFKNGVG